MQVEPVATGAVAPEVGKLPVGKLENGEAAAVREPTKPAPRAKYQLEPVEANQKDIYTNIKQAVLDPFFIFSDRYFCQICISCGVCVSSECLLIFGLDFTFKAEREDIFYFEIISLKRRCNEIFDPFCPKTLPGSHMNRQRRDRVRVVVDYADTMSNCPSTRNFVLKYLRENEKVRKTVQACSYRAPVRRVF